MITSKDQLNIVLQENKYVNGFGSETNHKGRSIVPHIHSFNQSIHINHCVKGSVSGIQKCYC